MLNEAFEANKTPAERERDDQIAANMSKMASFGLMPTTMMEGAVAETQPAGSGGVSTPPVVPSKKHASAAAATAPSTKAPPKANKGGKEKQGGAAKTRGDNVARPFDAKAIEAACDIGLALGGSKAVNPLPSSAFLLGPEGRSGAAANADPSAEEPPPAPKPGGTGQGEKRGRDEVPKPAKSHKRKAK